MLAVDDSKHCAHVSTVPLADSNGAFKCQDEEDGGPTYDPARTYFSDAEIEFAKQCGRQYGLFLDNVGGIAPVEDIQSAFDTETAYENVDGAHSCRVIVRVLVAVLIYNLER